MHFHVCQKSPYKWNTIMSHASFDCLDLVFSSSYVVDIKKMDETHIFHPWPLGCLEWAQVPCYFPFFFFFTFLFSCSHLHLVLFLLVFCWKIWGCGAYERASKSMKLIKGFEIEWGERRVDIARTINDVFANTWLPLLIK